jgi:pimeloyl-ACP methyl ester carboxylesterase
MTQKNKDGFLDVGRGHKIYWESLGNPEAPPLFLIHGGHGYIFDVNKMSAVDFQNRHVIVMHQRGIGKSTCDGDVLNGNTIAENTMDIERLRLHLNLGQIDLFSWSFGAVFMTHYAAQYPQNCRSLTSYAPYLASEDDWDIVTRTYAAMGKNYLQEKGASATYAGYCRDNFNKVAAKPDATAADKISAYLEHEALNGYPPNWLAHETAFARLDRIPVTLIFGANDVWVANNPNVQRVYPKASVVTVADASHDVHEPNVQKVLESVISDNQQRPRDATAPKKLGPIG